LRSLWGCPLTAFAEKERDSESGKERGRGGSRKVMGGREESD